MSKTKKLIASALAIVSLAAVPSTSIVLSGSGEAVQLVADPRDKFPRHGLMRPRKAVTLLDGETPLGGADAPSRRASVRQRGRSSSASWCAR